MKKSLVSLAVLAYVSSHPVYGQTATKKTTTASKTNTFKSEKLSPLPLESKRGDFQMREFDALEIPEYKLNEAYLEKSRQEISILGNLLNKSTTLNQRSDILFRTAELHWSIEKTIYFKKMEDGNMELRHLEMLILLGFNICYTILQQTE